MKSIDSWTSLGAEYEEISFDFQSKNKNPKNASIHRLAREKVNLVKPKQLEGLKKNKFSEQCRDMRETTRRRRFYLVMQVKKYYFYSTSLN